MDDFTATVKHFLKLGIPFRFYLDPEFLVDYDKHKQDVCISIKDAVDLNFKDGKFVGLNTQQANSWADPVKE